MAAKKQQVRLIFKLGAFGAFIMLGYLGIRNYKDSVEKLRVNGCIDEIGEITLNIRDRFSNNVYTGLDYKSASDLQIFPKKMFKEGYREALNSYMGGVDLFPSALGPKSPENAFEVSFQGLSQRGCMDLIRMNWENSSFLIAVAGYRVATPSGVLDEIYPETKQEDIKNYNIFKGNGARFASDDKLKDACQCDDDTCTVVWKFR
ncbi:MAG: hypothetical protein NC218_06620 [Acetobacter sp.]|nr:hypothetical protein [Acetobacter sp.]